MSGISITKEGVVEAAGCDPWALNRDFRNDTDVEAISSLASIFSYGSSEAEQTGSVAEYASNLEERAGSRGSNAIYEDAAPHLAQTHQDLGSENLENISRILGSVAEEAEATLENCEDRISGSLGADVTIENYQIRADNEYAEAEEIVSSYVAAAGDAAWYNPAGWFSEANWLTLDVCVGTDWEKSIEGYTSRFPMDEVADAIKESCIGQAALVISALHKGMEEDIDDYYGLLLRKETELGDYGYDTADSPVNIWRTGGRAEYEAEQLHLLLSSGDYDAADLEQYTVGLDSLLERLYGEAGGDLDNLTAAERRYLETYFNTLDGEDLATIGALEGTEYESLQETMANGVIGTWPLRPSSSSEFLESPAIDVETTLENFQNDVQNFNNFGSLMQHASVEPSAEFSAAAVDAAIDAQRLWEGFTMGHDYDASLDGAPQLLSLAARNDDAAADILGDPEKASVIVSSDWADDGEGAGSLIRAGTLPANGEEFTEEENNKILAGYNILQSIGGNPTMYLPVDGREPLITVGTGMEAAIGEVAGHPEYLVRLANAADNSDGSAFDTDRGDTFQFSSNDRHALFGFISRSDEDVVVDFKADLLEYTADRAATIFSGDAGSVESGMESLGELNGAFTNAELHQLHADNMAADAREQMQYDTWRKAYDQVASNLPGPAGKAAGMGGKVIDLAFPAPTPTAETKDYAARYEMTMNGGGIERYLIYDAARDAGYTGIVDDPVLAERADVIPRFGESWNDLSDDQWATIDEDQHGRSEYRAVENAAGDLMTHFESGRQGELGKDEKWYKVTEEQWQEAAAGRGN